MTSDEWVAAFAAGIGAEPPTESEISQVLDLAAVAAHASERIAAPVACWIAGRSGRPLSEVMAAADAVGTESD